MFSRGKVKIDPALYAKAGLQAHRLGYSSVNEYVVHLLERDLNVPADSDGNRAVVERLKGLGYLS